MKINKKTDLAIRILKFLDKSDNQDFISGNYIAAELSISYHHLRRIVPVLNELGFTTSKYGQSGGIKLSANARTIPISELLVKTELNDGCINDCENCIFNTTCSFEMHTKTASQLFCDYFRNIYIRDL